MTLLKNVVRKMNLLMKIDRWLGALLIVAGILGILFKWFSNQSGLSYILIGIVLVAISATADKKGTNKKRHS